MQAAGQNDAFFRIARKLVPACFIVGMSFEFFMVKTGFCACLEPLRQPLRRRSHSRSRSRSARHPRFAVLADDIVTRKEAERRAERIALYGEGGVPSLFGEPPTASPTAPPPAARE